MKAERFGRLKHCFGVSRSSLSDRYVFKKLHLFPSNFIFF